MPKETWVLEENDPQFIRTMTELQRVLSTEDADLNELHKALSAIEGVKSKRDPRSEALAEGLLTAEVALNRLGLSSAPLREEVTKFTDSAFTATGKALAKEKKDLLALISSGLTHIKKEFRLPARVEVKPIESRLRMKRGAL